MAAVADERSFVQFGTMKTAGDEIRAVGITVGAKSAHLFTDRSKGVADVFLFAVFKEGTFISGLVEMVMFMKREMFLNLFGDGGRVFV